MSRHTPDSSRVKLMYLFGSFRPSERAELLTAAESNPQLFLEALAAFLAKWAEASWIEEYNVERVGEWIAAKGSSTIRTGARQLAQSELTKAGKGPVHVKTYQALLLGMNQHSSALHSVHA